MTSYLLCGTPRTGSTLLCSLLASTGVAGRPQSYFREPDRQPLAAVIRHDSTPNGVFAARVMWGSFVPLPLIEAAVGPLRFVHLRRLDILGQAVSWARAEQTGRWQHDDPATGTPWFDLAQVEDLVATIGEHHRAWRAWFADHGAEPIDVSYEDLVDDPAGVVRSIATAIGVDLPTGWSPSAPQRKQADAVNARWVELYRSSRG